jgi:hypothetical protein
MYATKIKMKPSCSSSNNLLEIDSIYLTGSGNERFYKKEDVHDHLIKQPGTIQVFIYPYPNVIPMISAKFEKYVKSTSDSITGDNLLRLPRE